MCYPFQPRLDDASGIIGNDLFVATFRPFSEFAEEDSLGQLLIYSQCRQRWVASIDVPYQSYDASELQLLGFTSSFSIRALVRIDTENEVEVHLSEMKFDLELEEATITRQERVVSLARNDATTTLIPIFQPHKPWFLLLRSEWTNILELLEVDDFVVSEVDRVDPGLWCLFAIQNDRQLFLLCNPARDFNSNFAVLKSYDLDTGLCEIVNQFTPPETWVLPQNPWSLSCACCDNLIVVFHLRCAKPLFVFDVAQRRGYTVESPSCVRTSLSLLPSGEALMFARNGSCLQPVWLKPPSLSNVAMKHVLMYMPAKTRKELHSTTIVRPLELLQFLSIGMNLADP